MKTGIESIAIPEVVESGRGMHIDLFREYAFELSDLVHQRQHPGSELFS